MFTQRETWHFDTERIGRRALVYDRVDSTNTLGAALAQSEDADGLVLITDESTFRAAGSTAAYGRAAPEVRYSCRWCCNRRRSCADSVILTAWVAVSIAEAVLALHRHSSEIEVAE